MTTFTVGGPFVCDFAHLRTTRQKFSGPRSTFPFVVLTDQKILIDVTSGWQEHELKDAVEEAGLPPETKIFFWGLFYMPDEDTAKWGVARLTRPRSMPEVEDADVAKVTKVIHDFLVAKKLGPVVGSG